MKNILLTGVPGIGKTTIIQKVLGQTSARVGGFYTQEIREGKRRVGFRIVSLDGKEGILAHTHSKSRWRVGKYGVNVEETDRIGVAALERAVEESDLIVIDEIGRMELFSERFRQAVVHCLDSRTDVLGTIQMKRLPSLDTIRSRKDVVLIEVTTGNRHSLPETILNMIRTGGV